MTKITISPDTMKKFLAEMFESGADGKDDDATVQINLSSAQDERKALAIVTDKTQDKHIRIRELEKLGFWFKRDGKLELQQEVTDKVFGLVNTDPLLIKSDWSKRNMFATAILKFAIALAGNQYPKKIPQALADRIHRKAAASGSPASDLS